MTQAVGASAIIHENYWWILSVRKNCSGADQYYTHYRKKKWFHLKIFFGKFYCTYKRRHLRLFPASHLSSGSTNGTRLLPRLMSLDHDHCVNAILRAVHLCIPHNSVVDWLYGKVFYVYNKKSPWSLILLLPWPRLTQARRRFWRPFFRGFSETVLVSCCYQRSPRYCERCCRARRRRQSSARQERFAFSSWCSRRDFGIGE